MANSSDNRSLLLFRVGPVLCCAPSLPVLTIIPPPELTRPPGSDSAKPGIFKHSGQIVSNLDLRYKFGVDKEQWANPGRVVITQINSGCVGFWVDEIQEVMETPDSGWGALPPLLPRGIFSQTLLLNKKIYLYAEFDNLFKIPTSGYLRVYIEHLLEQQRSQAQPQTNNDKQSMDSTFKPHNKALDENEYTASNKTTTQKTKTKSNGKQQHKKEVLPKSDVPPIAQSTSESSTTANDFTSMPKSINAALTDSTSESSSFSQIHDPTKENPKSISLNKSEHTVEPDTTKTHFEKATTAKVTNTSLHDRKVTENKPELADKYEQQQSSQFKSSEKHTHSNQNSNRPIDDNNPFSKESAQHINNVSQTKSETINHLTQLNHSQSTIKAKPDNDQSIGFGFFLIVFLILATIPGLVWYISDSENNDSDSEILMFNDLDSNLVNKKNSKKTLVKENTFNQELSIANTHTEKTLNTDSVENYLAPTTNEIKAARSENNPAEYDEVQRLNKMTDMVPDTSPDTSPDTNINTPTNPETHTTTTSSNTEQASPAQSISEETSSEETNSTDSTSETDHQQSDYHADIKSDEAGITIILDAPEESPVFKLESQTVTKTPSTAENNSPVTKNSNSETEIELKIETNSTSPVSTPLNKTDTGQAVNTITRTEIIHIVVKGDTLWHIAIRYVNNPYKYPELARLSNIKNPDLIYPGNRVRIIKKSRKRP